MWAGTYFGSTLVSPPIASISAGSIASFGEDGYGELYAVDFSGHVMRLVENRPGALPLANADHDRDGTIAVPNIFAYLNDWFDLAPRADFNRSESINVQDIFDFLASWFAACP